ncbi:MAG: DUF928 domain-containing protein [Leptolyngbya sp. SIO4C1]|nr:DUF928 domain-containing protein [Leptolyngbya sp. SIO4C1]
MKSSTQPPAQSDGPLREGLPGRRISGGSRSSACLTSGQPVVALSPTNHLGVTMRDNPAVYFAMPATTAHTVEFRLRDTAGTSVYQTVLDTDEQALVKVQLPEQSLARDQRYQWHFSVVCDAQDRSQNIVLTGWLRRVSSELSLGQSEVSAAELALSAQLELAAAYQTAGLWSDAIAVVSDVYRQYPNNEAAHRAWLQLLRSLALESVLEPSLAASY